MSAYVELSLVSAGAIWAWSVAEMGGVTIYDVSDRMMIVLFVITITVHFDNVLKVLTYFANGGNSATRRRQKFLSTQQIF